MGEFFRGWRRRSGVVTLVMALAVLAVWQRSHVVCDEIHFNTGNRHQIIFSLDGRVYCWGVGTYQGGWRVKLGLPDVREIFERIQKERVTLRLSETEGEEWIIPYWSIVIPLTLFSAFLLLSKPRKSAPKKTIESIADSNDLKMKHEWAKQFMQAKNYDKAIPLLQAASKDIRLEAEILTSLGICFLAKEQKNLAKRQFEKALENLSIPDNQVPFKECHYYLGRIAEESGAKDAAKKHYIEILAIDYDYKNVVELLQKILGSDDESN